VQGEKPVRIIGPFLSRDDQDEYTKVVLKNGLTAILFERKEVPLVAISTYVKVGYLEEPDSLRGISHVMEHMFFKGTRRRDVGELAKETKSLGGYLNAGTYYEYTHYHTVLPSEHLRQGLDVQADALQNPRLSEVDLKREVQVILQEARRKADSPNAFALEKLYETAFEVSPIRRWRIGDESTLLPLTRNDLVDFHQQWYVPSNVIVVVCGNFDRRLALDEVVKQYAGIKPAKANQTVPAEEPAQNRLRYRQLRGDIGETRALMGFAAPAAFAKDWYPAQVLQAILTEGESSVLNRQLRLDRGWVTSVQSASLDLKNQGYFALQLSLDAARLDEAELAVLVELERIKSGALDDQDIDRAKNLLERKAYLDREDLGEFSFQLAHSEALASYREFRESIRRIRAVTREQIIQVAKTYFKLPRCTLLEYLPTGAKSRNVTPESLLAFFEQGLPAALKEANEKSDVNVEAVKPNGKKPSPSEPRRPAPAEVSTKWVDSPLTEYSILRGPEVMVKESRAFPLISIGVFFPGGRLFEGPANNGITELMARTSTKGTLKANAFDLQAAFERNGAKLESHVEPDFFGFVLTGLKSNFDKSLESFFSVIREPRFDEAEIQKEKTLVLAEASRLSDNQVLYSRQLVKRALYGVHPYGLPALGSPESIRNISREDLLEWHGQFVKNAVPVIVIAGDTEGSELVARLSGPFSSSTAEQVDLTMALPVKPLERSAEIVEQRDRLQSATALGFLTPGVSEPETRILTVLANMVSGLGGRFFEEVRENRGLAYTVSARYEPAALGGCFLAYVATSPENRSLAIEAIKEQLKKLTLDTVSEEELRRGKNYSSGTWKMRLQRREAQVYEFARLRIAGLSLDEIREYSNQYDFVRPEMIREVSRKYLDLSNLAIGGTLGRGGRRAPAE
jgi:zinc protease